MKKHNKYYLVGSMLLFTFAILWYFIFETAGFGITGVGESFVFILVYFSLLVSGAILLGMGSVLSDEQKKLEDEQKMLKENEAYYRKMQNI